MRRVISLPVVGSAAARSASPGARSADAPSDAAPCTEAARAPAPSSTHTLDESTVEATRPRTWGDCLREGWGVGAPCPWVGCRKHLLLELHEDRRLGYGLSLNGLGGRGSPHVSRPTTQHELDAFNDRALLFLFMMGESCSLRIGTRGAHTVEQVGDYLGMEKPSAHAAIKGAKASLKREGVDLDDPHEAAR